MPISTRVHPFDFNVPANNAGDLARVEEVDEKKVPEDFLPLDYFSKFSFDFLQMKSPLGQISLQTLFSRDPRVQKLRIAIEDQLKKKHCKENWDFLHAIFTLNAKREDHHVKKLEKVFVEQPEKKEGKESQDLRQLKAKQENGAETHRDELLKICDKYFGEDIEEEMTAGQSLPETFVTPFTSQDAASQMSPGVAIPTKTIANNYTSLDSHKTALSIPNFSKALLLSVTTPGPSLPPTPSKTRRAAPAFESIPLELPSSDKEVPTILNLQDTQINHINDIRDNGNITLCDFISPDASKNVLHAVFVLLNQNIASTPSIQKELLAYHLKVFMEQSTGFIENENGTSTCSFFESVLSKYVRAIAQVKQVASTILEVISVNNKIDKIETKELEKAKEKLVRLEKDKNFRLDFAFSHYVSNIIRVITSYNALGAKPQTTPQATKR